jgi:hypothetical protein
MKYFRCQTDHIGITPPSSVCLSVCHKTCMDYSSIKNYWCNSIKFYRMISTTILVVHIICIFQVSDVCQSNNPYMFVQIIPLMFFKSSELPHYILGKKKNLCAKLTGNKQNNMSGLKYENSCSCIIDLLITLQIYHSDIYSEICVSL